MSRPKKEHEPIDKEAKDVLEYIGEHGRHAQGKNELIKHLTGQRLTLKEAIKANCYECNGYFADEKGDCMMPHCPLYPFMAYNPNKIRSRNMSDEQIERMKDRFRKEAGVEQNGVTIGGEAS